MPGTEIEEGARGREKRLPWERHRGHGDSQPLSLCVWHSDRGGTEREREVFFSRRSGGICSPLLGSATC